MTASGPPLFVLGVRRSGTTLLRVMLDRSSELAIPDESYFIPQLAARHRGTIDPDAFLDDLRRIPRLAELGIDAGEVAARLREGMRAGEAIAAVFSTYAASQGKPRWGDKTPLYMQYLPLLERLFPPALYVHLVRDGRDAALSYLDMPEGIMTEAWGHPRDAAGFACLWRSEVRSARKLGRRVGPARYLEVRYEALVSSPEAELERICAFVGLPFEPALLAYAGTVDLAGKPHQQRLARPPTPGVRDWRTELAPRATTAFERIAGDLLCELGYETRNVPPTRASLATRARRERYRVQTTAWRSAGELVQRSPLWRRRHPAHPVVNHDNVLNRP